MCGCAGHRDVVAFCTCDCPSHANRIKLRATPKHRADVPVDSCRYDEDPAPCETCAEIDQIAPRAHRAEPTS